MKFKNHTNIKFKTFGKWGSKNIWKINLLDKTIDENSVILDIGCAAGNLSNFVNEKNYCGIDYNKEFVNFGIDNGIDIRYCDLSKGLIPHSDNKFDAVWFSHVIEHLSVREQVIIIEEILRVMKPGGTLFIFSPSAYNPFFYDNSTHVRPATHGSLECLALDAGFSFAEAKYSLIRMLPHSWQRIIRLTPLRWLLWEVYMIAKK